LTSIFNLHSIDTEAYTQLKNTSTHTKIIFPNPFNNYLQVKIKNMQQGEIILYNTLLEEVTRQKISGDQLINTEKLKEGIYFYEVINRDGVLEKGKIIKGR
jgi:hypothetical protein